MRNDFCENYLMHADRANHKYVAKVKLANGKFYYFYNLAQYQNYMKGKSGGSKNSAPKNVLKDPNKKESTASDAVKKQMSSDKTVQTLVNKKTDGATKEEKTAKMQSDIDKGSKAIPELINKASSSESSSSKKSGGGSSKSSGKSSAAKGTKATKSSGSGSGKSGSGKEKSAKEKSSKASEKQSTAKTTKKEKNTTPINMDSLKKIYGTKDEDVATHNMSSSEFAKEMVSKYDEGAFGYMSAGDKVYSWTIQGGKFILKDYQSGKEVSADEYLKDAKEFKEFQTNKKKK